MAFVISLFFIFVGVAAIIFIHLCIAGGALRHRHRRNERRPISGNGDLSSGYSLELLKTLPKSRFKGSEVCAICLDNLLEGEICRVLPGCNHVFHLNCVDEWILKSPVCPDKQYVASSKLYMSVIAMLLLNAERSLVLRLSCFDEQSMASQRIAF
ncbi:RING-H2 finger protein ATL56-like [Chenopodium quinoa]|uniref:RING-H2 finger protein ATL56-like n=1 Tax=Chenopodium quinoa TaxID=63459 RepID=UPI000B782784|nr:RING-H2 finger protein ATL56-like [Chenopodium quinoa]